MAETVQTSASNVVGRIMCVLFLVYGGAWIFIIGIEGTELVNALLGVPFIVFGCLWWIKDTPGARLAFGVLGTIGTFYSAIAWSNTIWLQSRWLMTLYSIALLALSLGIIFSVTCAWPDYDEYGK